MKVSIIDWIVKKLKRCIAIVEDGDTASQTISKGKYVIWKGTLHTADSNISSGDTLAASGSGKNLTAVSDGAANSLLSVTDALNSKTSAELGVYSNRVQNVSSTEPAIVTKRGNVCVISGYIEYLVSPTSYQTSILTIPNGYMPVSNIYTTVVRASDGKAFVSQIAVSSGNVNIFNRGEISTGDKFYLGITYVI